MKKTTKFLTIALIILAMVFAFIPSNVFAADETYSLTVNGTVDGRTFEIYKILNVDSSSEVNGTWNYAYSFTSNASNYFGNHSVGGQNTLSGVIEYLGSLQNNASELYTFANDYAADVVADIADVTGNDAQGVVVNGLEPGYYLVREIPSAVTPTSSNMLVQVGAENTNTVINLKAVTDEIHKTTNLATASVGDFVPYLITTVMPSTAHLQYAGSPDYNFTIKDTMSAGLDYVAGTVVVKVDGNVLEDSAYTLTNSYATADNQSANEEETLVIELGDFAKANPELAGKEVEITYSAIINENAVINSSVTNKVEYDRDGKIITTPDFPTVYVINAEFTKKSALGNTLNGAEFTLQYSENGERYSDVAVNQKGEHDYIVNTNSNNGDTIIGGNFNLKGLKAGFYKLVETGAPTQDENGNEVSGYNNKNFDGEHNNEFCFEITWDDTTKTATIVNNMSEETKSYLTIDNASVTYPVAEDNNEVLSASLLNSKAALLPSTGGVGTTIFTVVGIVVMVSAVGILLFRNRKNK